MFQRILICTDFKDGLYRLADFVLALASGGIRQITFLHVVPLDGGQVVPRPNTEKMNAARDRLSRASKDVPAGVEVHIEVQAGNAIDAILQVSKTHQSDLIILGMPYRNRLDQQLFGSTSRQVCQRMTLPLLIFRPELISAYTTEELELRCRHLLRYFLLPYDGSASAVHVVQTIQQIAPTRLPNSLNQVTLCWVVGNVSRVAELKQVELQQTAAQLEAVRADLASLGLTVETTVREGNALAEVLELAIEEDISAIAVSSASMGRLLNFSSPSFTAELLQRSWHPVLYIPMKR